MLSRNKTKQDPIEKQRIEFKVWNESEGIHKKTFNLFPDGIENCFQTPHHQNIDTHSYIKTHTHTYINTHIQTHRYTYINAYTHTLSIHSHMLCYVAHGSRFQQYFVVKHHPPFRCWKKYITLPSSTICQLNQTSPGK